MPTLTPEMVQMILLTLRAGNAALDHIKLMKAEEITPEILDELKALRKRAVQEFRDLAP